jgi:hypothetical protein
MPLAGFMIVLYTALQIVGVDTARFGNETEEALDDARTDGAA